MLVLTRAGHKKDANGNVADIGKLTITHAGETLVLTYLGKNKEGWARLGFEGPRSFDITRNELLGKESESAGPEIEQR